MSKTYEINATCPSCGCATTCRMQAEELAERVKGEIVELECTECKARYETPAKASCQEWDQFCQEEFSRLG